jgi:hypothetical protein
VKVVGFAGFSPPGARWNSPVTSFVSPFATDDVGRRESFSGARYQAEDWPATRR